MLMKIGDAVSKYGISHRSLHYWESAGILKSVRAENDYRYYDEENLLKIKRIVLLRKLRLSIPSIQEIFTSQELSKIIAVFADHLDETKKEAEQMNALGKVLRQILNMLRDRLDMDKVYNYLDKTHSAESEELKAALKTVLSEPVREITAGAPPQPIIDMSGIDLALEEMTKDDVPEVIEAVRRCYPETKEMDKLLYYFDFERVSSFPGCRYFYKITQRGECVGAVHLAYVGTEATLIRGLACPDPDLNIYLFELMKQKHPDTLCWMIRNAPDGGEGWGVKFKGVEDFNYDFEGQKQRFWEDNGFVFYTDARYNQFIKMMKPHDEVYNSSRYRFALLDGSMDGVAFRFFGANGLDFYDGQIRDWRVTDCYFGNALIYDTYMGDSCFYDSTMTGCDFRHTTLERGKFQNVSFKDCEVTGCEISGMTIDGVSVEEAIKAYAGSLKQGSYIRTDNPGPYEE